MLYGRYVTILMKTQVYLWYRVAGSKLVRMVVTRDPGRNLILDASLAHSADERTEGAEVFDGHFGLADASQGIALAVEGDGETGGFGYPDVVVVVADKGGLRDRHSLRASCTWKERTMSKRIR